MYLSKIELLPGKRTLAAIKNAQDMHRDISRLFKNKRDKESVLYRLMTNAEGIYVYVQSKEAPSMNNNFYPHMKLLLCRDITESINQITEIGVFHFDIECSPCVQKKTDGASRGKRRFLTERSDRIDWLQKKLREGGCELIECDDNGYTQTPVERGNSQFSFSTAKMHGTAAVHDKQKFLHMYESGIGPERAYGCGLMLVV